VKRALPVVFALSLAACGGGEAVKSDWERQNEARLGRENSELEVVSRFPAFPRRENLIEFKVLDANGFGFFVDRSSLAVGDDGVVRYVLVARSPSGVENVSYEGLRCPSAEFRRYALGRPDATWRASPSPLESITRPWHQVLHREFFCPHNIPLRTAAEGVRALEEGGHPLYKSFSTDSYRAR
jgi:hypothetical protein